jgi:hypothetical protein
VRRSWRVMSALALLMAAASILFSAWLFNRVQEERANATRTACQGTNDRQDETKARLDELIFQLPPARRARAEAGQRGTVLLIEALAPKRDCEALVERSVGSPAAR